MTEFTKTLAKQMEEAKKELDELPDWMKRVLSKQKESEPMETGNEENEE